MGIFDVFKTKVNEAADKAGDVAGQAWDKAGDVAGKAKDKASEMMDKKKGDADTDDQAARTPAQTSAPTSDAEAGTEAASTMVSEGAPVAATGEAAPGVGDDGSADTDESGGMTQSIKDNVAKGADKAGEMGKNATGNRYDEKIDTGVQQSKDRLS